MLTQFTILTAKSDFAIGLQGRFPIIVKIGDLFVVTNPSYTQQGGVKIDRFRTARINSGYIISHDQINELFNWE